MREAGWWFGAWLSGVGALSCVGAPSQPAGARDAETEVAIAPPIVCPVGTNYDGEVCRPVVVLECPTGASFHAGIGCIPHTHAAPAEGAPTTAPEVAPPPTASAAVSPAPIGSTAHCACAPGDLNCSMRCSARANQTSTERPFDRVAATSSLDAAAQGARSCARPGGPRGTATVTVRYEPSGRVSEATVSAPFAGTPAGRCVADVFSKSAIPPFAGPEPVRIAKSVTLD